MVPRPRGSPWQMLLRSASCVTLTDRLSPWGSTAALPVMLGSRSSSCKTLRFPWWPTPTEEIPLVRISPSISQSGSDSTPRWLGPAAVSAPMTFVAWQRLYGSTTRRSSLTLNIAILSAPSVCKGLCQYLCCGATRSSSLVLISFSSS